MKNNITNKLSRSVRKKIEVLKQTIKRHNKRKNANFKTISLKELASSGLLKDLEEKHKTDKRYGFILISRNPVKFTIDNLKIGYMETFKTREQDQLEKLCCFCKQRKSRNEFYKNKRGSGGLDSICKECKAILNSRPKRLASRIYNQQKRSSIRRGHPLPNYDILWLAEWLTSRDNFKDMHTKWIESGMESNLKPSVDRINPLKPYTKDNIQLMTWGENNKKGKSVDLIVSKDYKNNKDLYKDNLDIALRKISMIRAIYVKHAIDAKSKGIEVEYTKEWFSYFLIKNDIFMERFMEAINNNSKELIKIKIERLDLNIPFSKTNLKIG